MGRTTTATKTLSPATVWEKCLKDIQREVDAKAFHLWFKPLYPLEIKPGPTLVLQVPSDYFSDWLEQHYLPILRKVLVRHLGSKVRLEYAILHNGMRHVPASDDLTVSGVSSREPGKPVIPPAPIPGSSTHLNPELTFDNFIEGEANRMARQAALSIVKKGFHESFNPLFIYGPSGVGKTHLVHALGNEMLRWHSKKRIYYVNAEEFAVQYVEAVIAKKNLPMFLRFYQSLNVLIIDDIQSLIGKEKTQNTFFTLFDHLYRLRRQIIITSDRLPTDLKGMMDRLISRFRIGLLAEIQRPDYEMRLRILRQKAQEEGLDLPEEYFQYIAERVRGNARSLQGVLVSLLAHSTHLQEPMTMELVRRIVDKYREEAVQEVSVKQIIEIVSEYFGVTSDDVLSGSRKRDVVRARQLAMYVVRNFTSIPLERIGKEFGNKDHSTVIYACRKMMQLLDSEPYLQEVLSQVRKRIAHG